MTDAFVAESGFVECDVVLPYHLPELRWVILAIESILNQQSARCLLHVVGDAVDVEVHETLRKKFADAPDIRFYRNEHAIGPYRSFHTVFHAFRTPFSAFQASDDVSLPHRMHHSITELEKHRCDIFAGAMENFIDWRSADSPLLKHRIRHTGCIDVSGEVQGCAPSGKLISGTLVMRNETFKSLNGFADWFCSADTEFAERAQRAGVSVYVSDAVVLLRRMHVESLYHGRTHGHESAVRDDYNGRMLERYKLFTPGFDPRVFGSLDGYLGVVCES